MLLHETIECLLGQRHDIGVLCTNIGSKSSRRGSEEAQKIEDGRILAVRKLGNTGEFRQNSGFGRDLEVETDCGRKRELKDRGLGGLGPSALLARAVLTLFSLWPPRPKRASRNSNRGVNSKLTVFSASLLKHQ